MCRGRKLALQGADPPAQPSEWCCNLDGDLYTLLTDEEEAEYQVKSLKAAGNTDRDLAPCPKAGCDGLTVLEEGELHCTPNLCTRATCGTIATIFWRQVRFWDVSCRKLATYICSCSKP